VPWAQRESGAEGRACDWYDRLRPRSRTKLNVQGRRGLPDQCFWLPLRPLLIEFKAPGERPRPLQEDTFRRMARDGYDVQVHEDADEAVAAIRAALAEREREARALAEWRARLGR